MRSINGARLLGGKLSVYDISKEQYKLLDRDAEINVVGSEERDSEKQQPVEEPWLLRSTFFSFTESGELDDTISLEEQHKKKLVNLHGTDKKPPEDELNMVHIEEPESTVILINSSVCTMQRIAVLENDKLVELLLEPVKNNVKCDSIYLGVLTKLVPHMGGAFVDIGISRSSFMDIKQNREPFAFPPFHHGIEKEPYNNSSKLEHKGNFDVHGHGQPSYDEDDMTDSLSGMDHQNEHEVEDELDASDAIKINSGNDINGLNIVEADFDDEYADDFLPIEAESSNNSSLPLLIQESLRDVDRGKSKWDHVREGTEVIVQVVKEGLGTKGPALTAYPSLRSRFWVCISKQLCCNWYYFNLINFKKFSFYNLDVRHSVFFGSLHAAKLV